MSAVDFLSPTLLRTIKQYCEQAELEIKERVIPLFILKNKFEHLKLECEKELTSFLSMSHHLIASEASKCESRALETLELLCETNYQSLITDWEHLTGQEINKQALLNSLIERNKSNNQRIVATKLVIEHHDKFLKAFPEEFAKLQKQITHLCSQAIELGIGNDICKTNLIPFYINDKGRKVHSIKRRIAELCNALVDTDCSYLKKFNKMRYTAHSVLQELFKINEQIDDAKAVKEKHNEDLKYLTATRKSVGKEIDSLRRSIIKAREFGKIDGFFYYLKDKLANITLTPNQLRVWCHRSNDRNRLSQLDFILAKHDIISEIIHQIRSDIEFLYGEAETFMASGKSINGSMINRVIDFNLREISDEFDLQVETIGERCSSYDLWHKHLSKKTEMHIENLLSYREIKDSILFSLQQLSKHRKSQYLRVIEATKVVHVHNILPSMPDGIVRKLRAFSFCSKNLVSMDIDDFNLRNNYARNA